MPETAFVFLHPEGNKPGMLVLHQNGQKTIINNIKAQDVTTIDLPLVDEIKYDPPTP